jgi:hypothetical protein
MRRAPAVPAVAPPPAPPRQAAPISRPTLLDFFFILAGGAVSLLLFQIPPFQVRPSSANAGSPTAVAVLPLLEQMLRLPEGIILMWPLFFGIQRLLGRTQGLTLMEWLWVFAWIGTAVLAGVGAWQHWVGIPAEMQGMVKTACLLWYLILIPSMALLAVLIALLGIMSRVPPPWTHYFGVALVVWPVLPLGGILAIWKFA